MVFFAMRRQKLEYLALRAGKLTTPSVQPVSMLQMGRSYKCIGLEEQPTIASIGLLASTGLEVSAMGIDFYR